MAYLSSIKPLDFLEHASGTPLIIEAPVLHTHQLEDWVFFLLNRSRTGILFEFPFGDNGTARERGDAAFD